MSDNWLKFLLWLLGDHLLFFTHSAAILHGLTVLAPFLALWWQHVGFPTSRKRKDYYVGPDILQMSYMLGLSLERQKTLMPPNVYLAPCQKERDVGKRRRRRRRIAAFT